MTTSSVSSFKSIVRDVKNANAVEKLFLYNAELAVKNAVMPGNTIPPVKKIYACSINGRSAEDRLLIGPKINTHWFAMDMKSQVAVLHSTVAKLQYLVWDLIYAQDDYENHSSGACFTAFVPGFLVQLGDAVAVNLADNEAKRPVSSLTSSHHVEGNSRLKSGINITHAFGDRNAAVDPEFNISPDITPTNHLTSCSDINLLLASDAITDITALGSTSKQKLPPINLDEIKQIIATCFAAEENAKVENMAVAVANAIYPSRTTDDTSVIIFNSASQHVLGIVDGHGRKNHILFIAVAITANLPNLSSIKTSELPVLIKKGEEVFIYGIKRDGTRSFTKLDASKFDKISFPQINAAATKLIVDKSQQSIYDEIVAKDGHNMKMTGHYVANAVRDNFCAVLDLEIELYFKYCQTQTLLQGAEELSKQLFEIRPHLFGHWKEYRTYIAHHVTTYEKFFEKFRDHTLGNRLKVLADIKTAVTAELKPTPSIATTSAQSQAVTTTTSDQKQALLDFAKFQSDSLEQLQKLVQKYNHESKDYTAVQTDNISICIADNSDKSLTSPSSPSKEKFKKLIQEYKCESNSSTVVQADSVAIRSTDDSITNNSTSTMATSVLASTTTSMTAALFSASSSSTSSVSSDKADEKLKKRYQHDEECKDLSASTYTTSSACFQSGAGSANTKVADEALKRRKISNSQIVDISATASANVSSSVADKKSDTLDNVSIAPRI